MSESKVKDPELYDTLVKSTVKFDEVLELIMNLVQSQCTLLVAAQMERGDSKEDIEVTLGSFQSFVSLMEFAAEGILHLFQGYATGHLSKEEVVNLYVELAAVHDGREEGLISKRLNSNSLLEAAMEVMSAMRMGAEVEDNVFKFVTPSKDEYGPN